MITAKSYAALTANAPLAPFSFERRAPKEGEVLIDILYCGVCHSDLHMARNEWGGSLYPMVPGHEIVGKVRQVGSKVTTFEVGDNVGVGCMVDSCLQCQECRAGLEQYCDNGILTYSSRVADGSVTQGGYSDCITVRQEFVLRISHAEKDLAATAPLLCAGITTWSPLQHWKVAAGQRVGIVGLGGLGHMGVKLAHALGAEVTVLTTSPNKAADAKRLGAADVVISTDPAAMAKNGSRFDFIINTVSASHDLGPFINLLKRDGTMTLVGVPDVGKPHPPLHPFGMIMMRRSVAGSVIGGIKETQEMLDFCAQKGIIADIEMITPAEINTAYTRMLKNDVKYRFVMDCRKL
jgi:uncharacterized zinc-type alcohol dehydrogenase-like protein